MQVPFKEGDLSASTKSLNGFIYYEIYLDAHSHDLGLINKVISFQTLIFLGWETGYAHELINSTIFSNKYIFTKYR